MQLLLQKIDLVIFLHVFFADELSSYSYISVYIYSKHYLYRVHIFVYAFIQTDKLFLRFNVDEFQMDFQDVVILPS